MKKRIRIPSKLSLIPVLLCVVSIAAAGQAAAASGTACSGIPIAQQQSALTLIKSDVCMDLEQFLIGTQTKNQFGPDLQAIYIDVQLQFSLPHWCAASLILVFAQNVITGKISADS